MNLLCLKLKALMQIYLLWLNACVTLEIICSPSPCIASYTGGIIFLQLLVMMFHWRPSGSAPFVSAHFALMSTHTLTHTNRTHCLCSHSPTLICVISLLPPPSLFLSFSAFSHSISKGFSRPWQQKPIFSIFPRWPHHQNSAVLPRANVFNSILAIHI